jgi:hypothetical protein
MISITGTMRTISRSFLRTTSWADAEWLRRIRHFSGLPSHAPLDVLFSHSSLIDVEVHPLFKDTPVGNRDIMKRLLDERDRGVMWTKGVL